MYAYMCMCVVQVSVCVCILYLRCLRYYLAYRKCYALAIIIVIITMTTDIPFRYNANV